MLIYGSDLERLTAAAQLALSHTDSTCGSSRGSRIRSRRALLQHLDRAAEAAEELRARDPGRVVFVAGCEHSLFSRGMIPGPHTMVRLQLLRFMPRLRPRVNRRLNALLAQAEPLVRARFHGPVTYAAAFWEDVDWSRFDLIGINLYRLAENADRYETIVEAAAQSRKPFVITEFGCCAHVGRTRISLMSTCAGCETA